MKGSIAALAVSLSLLAALPAGAGATTLYPAGHGLVVAAGPMSISSSAGTGACTVSGVALSVPAAPANHATGSLDLPLAATPTFSPCSAGLTVTTSGTWSLSLNSLPNWANYVIPSGGLEIRYSGTPACKIVPNVAPAQTIGGTWHNGFTGTGATQTLMQFDATLAAKWANDGGSCVYAGQLTTVTFGHYDRAVTDTAPQYLPLMGT